MLFVLRARLRFVLLGFAMDAGFNRPGFQGWKGFLSESIYKPIGVDPEVGFTVSAFPKKPGHVELIINGALQDDSGHEIPFEITPSAMGLLLGWMRLSPLALGFFLMRGQKGQIMKCLRKVQIQAHLIAATTAQEIGFFIRSLWGVSPGVVGEKAGR